MAVVAVRKASCTLPSEVAVNICRPSTNCVAPATAAGSGGAASGTTVTGAGAGGEEGVSVGACGTMGEPVTAPTDGIGLGRTGVEGAGVDGKAAVDEFTELRWITVQTTPRQYPF